MAIDNILHLYKDVYYALPQSVKTFIGTVYGNIPLKYRFGKPYDTHFQIVNWYENASKQEQLDFLFNKTYETLTFAQKHIPFYQNTFNEYGVSVSDFKSLSDISKFPTLTKEDIKNNLNLLYSSVYEKPTPYYTGGSTSTPTKYYLPLFTSRGKEKAYNEYMFSKVGKTNRKKTLLLKGREVAKPEKDIYWEYEPVDNYLVVSSNYLNSDKFDKIYNTIKDFSPEFVFGYPSAIIDFIKASRKFNIENLPVKGVISASEMVYDEELNIIKEFFKGNIITHYGHTERAAIAYRYNYNHYRILNSYGVVRESKGEIITTSFDNFVMPFINYETNDYFSGKIEKIPTTDIVTNVENIEGRLQEYLVAKDGRLISICVMGAGHYSSLADVENIQYTQEKPGKANLLIQTKHSINTENIKKELESFTKDAIEFNVQKVDKIIKSSRGKRIMCKQKLDINQFR
jgi:phenylacetate-CoA ligase